MLPQSVEQVLEIAARETQPEALEAYRSQRAPRGERMRMRDGVAILDVVGPMFKGANLMTELSGATSYDMLRRDLQAALDDPGISGIILSVDSPGGEAHGADQLAQAIYAARGPKPIWAYVGGMGCSAAYWIASAADRIVVSDLGTVGSIGAVISITDRRKADEARGVSRVEFVSSQSPGKRPDVTTDAGRARVQKFVDDIGAVFVAAVAKHRGVSVQAVISKFGAGGVEIGANAVRAGMADEVGQFEAVLQQLAARGARRAPSLPANSRHSAPLVPPTPAFSEKSPTRPIATADDPQRAAIAGIRRRAAALLRVEGADLVPTLRDMLLESEIETSAALKILTAAAGEARSTPSRDLRAQFLAMNYAGSIEACLAL